MSKQKYDDEKVIFGEGEASFSFLNPNRSILIFLKNEINFCYEKNKKIKIIDIGCGAGNKTRALRKIFPTASFWGCDISKNAIKIANNNSKGIKFFVADATKLPLKDNQFDIVYIHSVLDHTKNPQKVVKEASRVLKKEGTLLLTDPLEDEPTTIHGQLTRFKSFRNLRKERCGHLYIFSKKTLIGLIENNGFKVESIILDWFFLRQLIDVVYYPLLTLTGRGAEYTIDSYLKKNKPSFAMLVLDMIKKAVTFLENFESLITYRIPLGWFAYIKAIKK